MARTTFKIIDKSDIPSLDTAVVPFQPLYFFSSSTDKGPETYNVYEGQNFVDTFISNIKTVFDIHGQALLEAVRCAEAGGKIFFKRIVAEDSTLANVCVNAVLTKETRDVTDANGMQLYIEPTTGNYTTSSSRQEIDGTTTFFEKLTSTVAVLNLTTSTAEDFASADLDELGRQFGEVTVDNITGAITFPLFVVTEAGRGLSKKSFSLIPDYVSSRAKDYTKYVLSVYESNSQVDSSAVCLNYAVVENKVNMGIESKVNDKSTQVRVKAYYENINTLVEKIAEITGMEPEEVMANDFLYGKSRKGNSQLSTLLECNDAIGLSNSIGVKLVSGSNGEFGNAPMAAASYEDLLAESFGGGKPAEEGEFDEEHSIIYDVDNYKIDIIADANYPAKVKRSIEKLVEFRMDAFYFRDLGLGLRTLDAILMADDFDAKSCYCATYHNSYDVYDPYSRKRINVTIMYDLAPLLVSHFVNGENRPLAGFLHDLVFDNIIPGSLNFSPKITPAVDQKQELDDARINYIAGYDNVYTLDSEWTSQEAYTQLSFINNILLIQKIIKEIRTKCPKIRYGFLEGNDLVKYQEDIEAVLNNHQSKFKTLEFVYFADPLYESNKIFYAGLNVTFRNFVQDELFVITALSS